MNQMTHPALRDLAIKLQVCPQLIRLSTFGSAALELNQSRLLVREASLPLDWCIDEIKPER